MSESLLPPNATGLESALEQVTKRMAEVPVPLRELWRYQDCPAHLLPWLAWGLGVDEWNPAWSEGRKRAAIRDALRLQQHKGTLWAVRQAAMAAGLGSVRVIEGNGSTRHDGLTRHDGRHRHGDAREWAACRVVLSQPVRAFERELVRRLLTAVMPARCHLIGISFEEGSVNHSGLLSYDGTFTHGEV